MNYELRVTNYELGKAYVLWICGIRNVKFNIEKYLRKHLSEMSVNFSVIHDGVANFQFAFVQRTRRRLKACYSKSVNSFLKFAEHSTFHVLRFTFHKKDAPRKNAKMWLNSTE